ncbi:hypothetical protein [Niveibacterium sp. SC-1]|uniref:HEAT repeat domain-containing protein n=1 Tax=Niveibacterium sp. SC-1 TaxID=3135646 RepID=UPI00311E384E
MGLLKPRQDGAPAPLHRERDALLAQLAAASAAQRAEAAGFLADYRDSAEPLLAALAREGESAVRRRILSTLVSWRDPAPIAALVARLRQVDGVSRNEIMDALRDVGGPVEREVPSLLAASDPDLRLYAFTVLRAQRSAQVLGWIEETLAHETDANVAAAALELLAQIGTPAEHAWLEAPGVRFADVPFIQFAIAAVARRTGTPA